MQGQDLVQLLARIISAGNDGNDGRHQAEEQLSRDWLVARPADFLMGMCQMMNSDQQADVNFRSFCAILFRRMGLREVVITNPHDGQQQHHPAPWYRCSAEQQRGIKQQLLNLLGREPVRSVRHKLCDSIAELQKLLLMGDAEGTQHEKTGVVDSWPELMPAIFECAKNQASADLRESAFQILTAVPGLLLSYLTAGAGASVSGKNFLPMIEAALVQGLQDPASAEVRLAALKASVALLKAGLDGEETGDSRVSILTTQFADHLMVPMMNQVLLPFYAAPSLRNEECLVQALAAFIELGEQVPKSFRKVAATIVQFVQQILVDREELGDSTRQTALELALTLAENAPGLCRKLSNPGFAEQLLPATIKMMSEMDDDEDWHTTEQIDEFDDPSDNYIVAEQAMDRFSRALGGKHILPSVSAAVNESSQSSQWNERYAAMMCLSAVGEGAAKLMKTQLQPIMATVINCLLSDPHPRVRYAACNAVGQMCTDFGPQLQQSFHQPIVGALCQAMKPGNPPRVQAHAAAALVNFCEHSDAKQLAPYLDAIFTDLLPLTRADKMYLQEQAITSLATIADTAADYFVQYFPLVMPSLLETLQATEGRTEYRLLRGKTIECASLMALAVGKEPFRPFSQPFIQIMVATQRFATDPDDPQVSYLLASWARLCKVLGQEFVPYLELVMPPLLESARHKPDFTVLDPEDNAAEKGFSEEDGWEFVKVDDQQIGIKTTALEEKCTAVEMLICYARELGPGFRQYAEEVLRVVVPLLRFYFHEGVRHAAAMVIPHLFKSLKESNYNEHALRKMWHETCSSLLMVINDESEAETLIQFLIGFFEAVSVMGPGSLTGALFQPIHGKAADDAEVELIGKMPVLGYFARAINGQIAEVFHRIQDREKQRQDQEIYDPEMEEALQNEDSMEDVVLGELSRAVHIVCRTHGTDFLPYFHQELLPAVSGMLRMEDSSPVNSGSNTPNGSESGYRLTLASQARQFGICVFDDIIEFIGCRAAQEYWQYFWEPMLRGAMDHNCPDVRQAACYGIGTLAVQAAHVANADQALFSSISGALLEAMNALLMSLSMPWARRTDQAVASENAVSAVGKILRHVASTVLPAEKVSLSISQWLHHLSVTEDEEEAVHAYGYLIELINKQEPALAQNLALVGRILVECVTSEVLLANTGSGDIGRQLNAQAIEATKAVLAAIDRPVKMELWNGLDVGKQQKLAALGLA